MFRDNLDEGGGSDRRVVRRRLPPVQPIAEGEPDPNGVPAPPPQPQYVTPFSYETPRFNPGRNANYNYRVPRVPRFYAPAFQIPTAESVFNDPSYQFRLNQGLDALQRSAAAKGMLRTGNTLQDLMNYAQDYASQEYGNTFNRAAQAYGLNYQGLRDMYAPQLAEWQARTQAEQDRARYAADRAWQEYAFGIDDEFRREQMLLGAGR